ncbi:MAG: transglutaminase, partial [Methanoregula sp.]
MNRIIKMPMITSLVLIAVIFAAGCMSGQTSAPVSQGDTLYAQAENAFAKDNFHAATELYGEAYDRYKAGGKTAAAKDAYNKASISVRMTAEFPFNRSEIVTIINETFPEVSADRKAGWLPCDQSQCIMSDGETWYFANTINNIRSHNLDLTREATAEKGETPFYDQMKSIAFAPPVEGAGNYQNPVVWDGTEILGIPVSELPKTGTLRLWIPLPV